MICKDTMEQNEWWKKHLTWSAGTASSPYQQKQKKMKTAAGNGGTLT
jgi:hypothetical protein